MTTLIMIAQLILGLSILVALHEMGHFIAARAFGVKVEKFYIFFDFWKIKLFKFKKGDTEYGIGWFPLGGYVKIAGMIDESLDTEKMKEPPQPCEFRSKPAWQRLIIMLAGVIVNAILGIILFTFVLLHYEKEYLPNEALTEGVYAYETARAIGFQSGDKIVSVNGNAIERFKDALAPTIFMGGKVVVERKGQQVEIAIPDTLYKTISTNGKGLFLAPTNYSFKVDSVLPEANAAKAGIKPNDRIIALDSNIVTTWGQFSELVRGSKGKTFQATIIRNIDTLTFPLSVDTIGMIGITAKIPYANKSYNIISAIHYGFKDAWDMSVANVKGLGKVFSGKVKATDSVQGPIGIAKIYGGVWDWQRFWFITGLLSLILAFMNILPIPALDGGHVIFLTIEAITGKKFSDKFLERAQIVGMVILLAIMAFAIGNDLYKVFFK